MDSSVKFRLVGATVVLLAGIVILPPLLKAPPPELVIEDYIPPQPPQVRSNNPDLKRQDWTIGDVLANQGSPDLAALRPQASVTEVQQPESDSQAEEILIAKPPSQKNESRSKNTVPKPVDISFDHQGVPIAWSIQVASFANHKNAKRLETQLIEKGYKAQIRATPDAKLTRVYVGPSMDKQGLEKDKQAIERQFKLTSQIVRYRPGE